MREIKFRALNSNDEFIFGLPYTDDANRTVYYDDYNNRLCWRNEDGAHCNRPYKNGTLEQFTGLTDQKGDEIYEGDIVECTMAVDGGSLPHRGEIVFVETFGAFATKNQAGETLLHNHHLNTFQIIGNIHHDPDIADQLRAA